ncbi:Protein KRI1 [Ceratocystis fimbriata CBS 114723]|uniref:Protein KRI1 n=1 Tax=Ceratocystis fimbriata CBS 114723 TaxID=1035309 RepID=A0A2C5XHG9_9PEZI|nr:Protein KRI1 [Ceratocystis fimbriata CBS 114723]
MGSTKATESVASKKKTLFDDNSDSEVEGGAKIKINTEFAKRFEHNKRREEKQKLEEKFKREGRSLNSDSDSGSESSSGETEDEDGFLATEALDAEISATLNAIRKKDPRIYDKSATFYTAKSTADADADASKSSKEKPLYLKDYHREQYLKGAIEAPDHDEDEDVPMTYTQEQDALKKSLVSSIHAAATTNDSNSDSENDGSSAFLKRKTSKQAELSHDGVHPERKVDTNKTLTENDVANADKNPELFLSNFMSSRAWVPPDGSNWQAFGSEDEDSDVDRAEAIEHAYNMRFEDPEKSNEVLTTYARDLTNARSVRREELKGRKRQRELERERKAAEKQQRRDEKARFKKLKLDEMQTKLDQIRKTAGAWGKQLTEDELLKFLNDTWENDKWEDEMRKRFGEDYYEQQDTGFGSNGEDSEDEEVEEDGKMVKKPKKPTWDDDIDISKIVGEVDDDENGAREFTVADLEDSGDEGQAEAEAEDEDDVEDGDESEESRPSKKRKTSKDHKKDRLAAKKAAKTERSKLSAIVDLHMDLEDPDTLALPTRRKKTRAGPAFRYRETSPNSFGLTPRDVLLAPSDTALKKFASIKKYAEWRLPEQKQEDTRRLGKKARLRKWRREVFGKDFEKTGPTYGFKELFKAEEEKEKEKQAWRGADASDDDVKVRKADTEESGKKKKRRSKKKSGKATAET